MVLGPPIQSNPETISGVSLICDKNMADLGPRCGTMLSKHSKIQFRLDLNDHFRKFTGTPAQIGFAIYNAEALTQF